MINYSEDKDRQYHIQTATGEVGRYVILPGDPKRCAKIAEYFTDARLIADNREYVTYTGYLDGERISVTSTGIGGPSAAIAMEELARCGADTFIRVGTSGGMAEEVKSGDVVIAAGAIRMDGTSKEYVSVEYPAVAHIDVVNALSEAAGSLGYDYHTGVVQCKDSFYGQHDPEAMPKGKQLMDKWHEWIKCGCLASEMESATLFIVGSILRVRVGSVLLVMANQERAKKGLDNPVVRDVDLPIKTAIEALRTLIRKDRESAGEQGFYRAREAPCKETVAQEQVKPAEVDQGQAGMETLVRKQMKPEIIEKLVQAAIAARVNSYAPYSHFTVGAALICGDESIYTGCNIENAAYTPSNCAERTTFFKAVSEGKRDFDAICIVNEDRKGSRNICPPCGVCLQVMMEFCDPEHFRVIMAASLAEYQIFTLKELLPRGFAPEQLA